MAENPMLEMDTACQATNEEFAPAVICEDPCTDDWDNDAVGETPAFWSRDPWMPTPDSFSVEFTDPISRSQSFTAMLLEQISVMKLGPQMAALSGYLVECLNNRGYLDIDPQEIALELKLPLFDVMQVLYLVQSLQPVGTGARSLQECLILQLSETKFFNSYTIKIIKEGLALLAANDLRGLSKLLQTDICSAARYSGVIRFLNPIPSQGYDTGENDRSVVPDVSVRREGNQFSIVMNDTVIPNLELNREYCDMLGKTKDLVTKRYLKEHLHPAQTLIHAVGERNATLIRVMEYVVRKQAQFFEDGKTLVPMTLSEVAEKVGLNVSTISRAVQEKFIICAAGIIRLRSLFTSSAVSSGNTVVSSTFVKEKIQKCLKAESKESPLSDQDICMASGNEYHYFPAYRCKIQN